MKINIKSFSFLTIFILLISTVLFFLFSNFQQDNKLKVISILSIGDSITEGSLAYLTDNHWLGNYNLYLEKILENKKIKSNFLGHGSYEKDAPYNEGHGGYCISPLWEECRFDSDVTKLMENSLLNNIEKYLDTSINPDVIILQGGINDINVENNGRDVGNLNENYSKLIDIVKNKREKALIIVIPPFYGGDDLKVKVKIDEIRKFLRLNYSSDRIVILPSENLDAEENFIGDYIHPNELGYQKMASLIFEAIDERLIR